ncbi:hypothetical protein B0T20DRAFT_131625 [Sordaria brevicollis]|uniref:Uncharacterized protein n=1 Tax=Sordaria brevicollis TaxID=83679 RepID=A0AAE0PM84_SORBR|nr:hypothetical protein B0T20DRAFT_131625 [Sordaria brevicollis]
MAPSKSKKPKRQGKAVVNISPILSRFELEDVFINQRHNNFKDPQLVLKSQLDRSRGITSNAGVPVWHHELMIHVKDKADELAKLDLEDFTPAAKSRNPPSQCTAACSPSERAFMFWYPMGSERASLLFSMKTTSGYEDVLREMKRWEVTMASSRHGFGHNFWIRREQQGLPAIPQINPLTVARSSSRRHRRYITNVNSGLLIDANHSHPLHSMSNPGQFITSSQPVQHLSQPLYIQPLQEWSPRSLIRRSASTVAVPGTVGEGVYKISRVKSNPVGRSRITRLPSLPVGGATPTYLTRPRIARQPSSLTSGTESFNHASPVIQLQPTPPINIPKMTRHVMAGLKQATMIFNEHMRRGRGESDLVGNLQDKIRIWIRHAKVCHQDLKEVESATARRIIGQPVSTGVLRRLSSSGIGPRFHSNLSSASRRPVVSNRPQQVVLPPVQAGSFTLSAPSRLSSSI